VTLTRGETSPDPRAAAAFPVVRTGVTAVMPHPGNLYRERPRAASFTRALAENPDIGLTAGTVNPVVGECSDAYLNDIRGRHVTEADCLEALRLAAPDPVPEGNVGAGTGLSCLGFKGGLGTASRLVTFGNGARFTLGCLVLANFGRRADFRLDGVPVGRDLVAAEWSDAPGPPATADEQGLDQLPGGSIMIVLATDAPLTSRQLTRVSRRAALGLARTGSVGAHGSGDFVLAFSTAGLEPAFPSEPVLVRYALAEDDRHFGPLFEAAVEATEEAIVNALFAAETMAGRDGHVREALPIEEVISILRRHGRV